MSYHAWMEAKKLREQDPPFYALIMAAMVKADTLNAARLRSVFPDVFEEVEQRYNAGGGLLPGEPGYDEVQAARHEAGLNSPLPGEEPE